MLKWIYRIFVNLFLVFVRFFFTVHSFVQSVSLCLGKSVEVPRCLHSLAHFHGTCYVSI